MVSDEFAGVLARVEGRNRFDIGELADEVTAPDATSKTRPAGI
ncbi:MAG: hypothetical protein ACP5G4_02565 [bacterium]